MKNSIPQKQLNFNKKFIMDQHLTRFPLVGQDIFKQLDDKTLANCKNVSKFLCNFLNNCNLLWQRRIRKLTQNQVEFSNHWKLATEKTPIDILQKLAIVVEEFFTLYPEEFDPQLSPLHIVGAQNSLSLYNKIFERIGLINPACTKDGRTPLLFASDSGHLEIVKYISDHLEQKNPAKNDGWTPLHAASQEGHLDIAKYIAGHLENKNPTAHDGETTLHSAADNGHEEICKLIIDSVMYKNPMDAEGATPLHYASENGHKKICKLIIDSVIDKNPKDARGWTPLHFAAKNGHKDVFKLIMDACVDKNPKNAKGYTPLYYASKHGHNDIARFIMGAFADKTLKNAKG